MHNSKQNSADFVKNIPQQCHVNYQHTEEQKNFKYIATDCVVSAWRLLTDKRMLHRTKKCTDAEGKRQLGDDTCPTSVHEIEAFASLLYGRGA